MKKRRAKEVDWIRGKSFLVVKEDVVVDHVIKILLKVFNKSNSVKKLIEIFNKV